MIKGNIYTPIAPSDFVKGVSSPINVPARNVLWASYLPTYEPQKFTFDTDSCWALSGINIVDTQLNYLKSVGAFSQDSLNFFTTNGYFDSTGSFATSERFIEILSGVEGNGNSQWAFWQLVNQYGLIPRSQLEYTQAQASQFPTDTLFYADYFNPSAVTAEMKNLGQDFLQHVNIQYEWLHNDPTTTCPITTLQEGLTISPLQLGVPVAALWNQVDVPYDGNLVIQHAIELYDVTSSSSLDIRDQYQPDDKVLATGYFVPLVTAGIVTAITPSPVAQPPTTVVQEKIGIIKQLLLDLEEELALITKQ